MVENSRRKTGKSASPAGIQPQLHYYNENDPKAAEWLRELILHGHIPAGVVDERSITEIKAHELTDYASCHFFAGIGGWPAALRLAGVADNEPRDTGSCPCQPFSDAGKGEGETDARHLWPAWFDIIRERRPATLYGEQVASKAALRWWDGVQADLESEGYAAVAFDLCSASVGAPTIRQRLFWIAYSTSQRRNGSAGMQGPSGREIVEANGSIGWLAGSDGGDTGAERQQRSGQHGQQPKDGGTGRMDDSAGPRLDRTIEDSEGNSRDEAWLRLSGKGRGQDLVTPRGPGFVVPFERLADALGERGCGGEPRGWDAGDVGQPIQAGGFYSKFDLCLCTDGKARRIEPGSFPLVASLPGRVGLLRGYGNAINIEAAAAFIRIAEESMRELRAPQPA